MKFNNRMAVLVGILIGIIVVGLTQFVDTSPYRLGASLVLLIIFLTLFLINYEFQLLFFILATPLLIYVGERGFNPFSWSDMIIYLMIFILTLESLVINKKRKIKSRLFFPVLLFVGWAFFMVLINSTNLLAGVGSFIVHVKYIPLFYILPVFIDKKIDIENIIKVILSYVFITAVWGFYLISNGVGYAGAGWTQRAVSIFPNPNMLGVYLGSLIPLGLIYWMRKEVNFRNIIYTLIFLTPLLTLIILTSSRRTWVALILGMLILLWRVKERKIRFTFIIIFALLMIGFLLTMDVGDILLRIKSIYLIENPRIDSFTDTIRELSSSTVNLLIGAGPGTYGPASSLAGETHLKDSYYHLLFAEYGIMGLLLFMLILGAQIIEIIEAERKNSPMQTLLVNGLALAVFVILVSGLVGTTPITSPNNMNLWIFVGLIAALKNIGGNQINE